MNDLFWREVKTRESSFGIRSRKKAIQKYENFEKSITKTLSILKNHGFWQVRNLCIHDIREEKIIQFYEAHYDTVNDISVHPSGNFFTSVSGNSEIKVWDIRKSCLVYTMYGHSRELNTCRFSQKGDYFAKGGSD